MHASNQKQKQKNHSIHGAVRRLYLHTHTRPMKKGILQPSLLLLKRAIKYIKTYIYSAYFLDNKHWTSQDKSAPVRVDPVLRRVASLPCFLS